MPLGSNSSLICVFNKGVCGGGGGGGVSVPVSECKCVCVCVCVTSSHLDVNRHKIKH